MTISAKIIADSINQNGKRITTFELEYPRFIHSEYMTHRLFSRNAASSRAIPVKRSVELIMENTAMPIHWGKNRPGMSAKEECNEPLRNVGEIFEEFGWPNCAREHAWRIARDNAINVALQFDEAGYHKQLVNRLLETYSHIKVVMTATELDNWFWLRNHSDAQPEINELARVMLIEFENSTPHLLEVGDWHVPYFEYGIWKANFKTYYQENFVKLEDAIAISSSCCAQVSYRRLDDSLEKARDIYKRLIETRPVHASPFEHQATVMVTPDNPFDSSLWDDGITHVKRDGSLWSGNFCGWVQNRQLIDGNTCWNYNKN